MATSVIKKENPYNNASVVCKCPKIVVNSLTSGEPYSNWGGVFYYKIGCRVHLHIGVSNLPNTDWTANALFTLPSGYIPSVAQQTTVLGQTNHDYSTVNVLTNGQVRAYGGTAYALADIEYDVF